MSRERELTEPRAEWEPDFETPGTQLKRAREKAGVELQAIGRELHMSTDKLEALERDQYEKLPSEVFVQGYLRRYAKLVGLDETVILDSFNRYLTQLRATTEPITQVEETQPRPPAFQPPQWLMPAVVFGVAVMVLGAVIWLTVGEEPAPESPGSQPPVSETPLPPPPGEETDSAAAPADSATEPAPVESTQAPVADGDSAENTPPTTELDTVDSAPSVPTESASAGSVSTGELRFEFAADCWVKVTDASGEVIHASLETADSELSLQGQPPFEIMLGNARAVDLAYNGENIPVAIEPGFDTARITVGENSQ